MPVVELWFGKIDGGVAVFLNGQKIGSAGDSRAASVYDVKKLLRAGENILAVTLANYGPWPASTRRGLAPAGHPRGGGLEAAASSMAWPRSLCNPRKSRARSSSPARAKVLSSVSIPDRDPCGSRSGCIALNAISQL